MDRVFFVQHLNQLLRPFGVFRIGVLLLGPCVAERDLQQLPGASFLHEFFSLEPEAAVILKGTVTKGNDGVFELPEPLLRIELHDPIIKLFAVGRGCAVSIGGEQEDNG